MEQILKSRYRTGEKISESVFSVTYKGFYIGTDKPVIIKIYKRGTLNSSLIRQMRQKVKDFSLFNHSGIAKIIDGDYGWQGFYYVREFIDGSSLSDLLRQGEKFDLEKAVDVIKQTLVALEITHAKNIVHGALKPSNVFIEPPGTVKVADFVIEAVVKDAMPQKAIELIEDAHYASPEELLGEPATPVSDLYSLTLILCELVAGKPVLHQTGLKENIKKLKTSPFSPDATLPKYLADIIVKGLQKDPLLRFRSAGEFRESLEKKYIEPKPSSTEEYVKIFENSVTQYGGEEINQESEALREVGRVRLRWSKEKHRNWILGVAVAVSVALGFLYTFIFGR
jgi:serine/threonine-protein kinase